MSNVDEAIKLLTGVPSASINQRVEARLVELAERRLALESERSDESA